MRRKSQGSALVAVLMILLILMMGLSAFQYLSSSTLRQYRQEFAFEDHQARADGLLEMLISRWKYHAQGSANHVMWLDQTWSERGVWEGHEFVFAWYFESMEHDYPVDRAIVWIRFLDNPAPRAYRYDLMIRMPFPFKPRMVEVMGSTIEAIDPENPEQRKAAFEASPQRVVRPPEIEARVEAFSEAAERIAAAGDTPDKMLPLLAAPADGRLVTFLTQWAGLSKVWEPAQKRSLAEALTGAAQALGKRWQDLARFELAQALITCGNWEVGSVRQGYFQDARTLLEAMLLPGGDGECCGKPIVTWILANLLIRMRQPLDDPDEFKRARTAAMQMVGAMVDEQPGRFVHERTDICVEELPIYLDTLWKGRVAVGACTPNSMWVITSMLEDGTKQLVHQEMWVTPTLLHWERDGGHWIMTTMDGDETASGEGVWRVPIFGTEPEMIFPNPLNVAATSPPIANIAMVHPSADGGLLVSGTLDPDKTYKAREGTWTKGEYSPVDPADPDRDGVGERETDLSTAHEFWTGPMFRLAIRGSTVHQVFAFDDDWYEPMVFSPDASKVAYLVAPSEAGQPTNVVIVDAEKFWRGETPLTFPIGATEVEMDFDQLPPPIASLPVEWDAELSRISWERYGSKEWISLASVLYTMDPGRMDVYWVDPAAPRGSNMVVQRQPPMRFFLSENGVSGRLIRSPRGLLSASGDRILLFPLPDESGQAKTMATDIPANSYSTLGKLRAMPWGETAMFIGCTPDLYHDFFRIDLQSGRTEMLIGPNGRIPGLEDVWDFQISPIPERL